MDEFKKKLEETNKIIKEEILREKSNIKDEINAIINDLKKLLVEFDKKVEETLLRMDFDVKLFYIPYDNLLKNINKFKSHDDLFTFYLLKKLPKNYINFEPKVSWNKFINHTITKIKSLLNSSDIRFFLKERLPTYLIPSIFIKLEQLEYISVPSKQKLYEKSLDPCTNSFKFIRKKQINNNNDTILANENYFLSPSFQIKLSNPKIIEINQKYIVFKYCDNDEERLKNISNSIINSFKNSILLSSDTIINPLCTQYIRCTLPIPWSPYK
jgi:hypothetical protein